MLNIANSLSGKPPFSETSRSLHQLHKQIISLLSNTIECLRSSVGDGADRQELQNTEGLATQPTSEFLDFLEAQSKTQMKILEVEIKAGQELNRLLKSQYEQDRKSVFNSLIHVDLATLTIVLTIVTA